MRRIFLLFVLLLGSAVGAEARCYVSPWHTAWDTEGVAYAQTTGTPCQIAVNRVFGTGELHTIRIVEAPHHGAAFLTGFNVGYRPRPGFKGEDSFVFLVAGRDSGKPRTGTVRVRVTVQ
jgi:hypothetical protein